MLIMTDRKARKILRVPDKASAIFVGANFLIGAVFLILSLVVSIEVFFGFALAFLLSSIPFSCVIYNDNTKGRILYGTTGFLVFTVINAWWIFNLLDSKFITNSFAIPFSVTIFLFVITMWMASFGVWRK